MNRSIRRAWLIAGAVFPILCLAQNASLDEVLILGTQIEESIPADLQKYGSRLEVISGEQLRAGGYNDLSQALQMLVPGLYVAPKNGPFDYVDASLLGSRGGDILYLIDGVRISNRLYNTTTPLDTIPAHMVERIEVLKGGQSLFYGINSHSASAICSIANTRHWSAPPAATSMAPPTSTGTWASHAPRSCATASRRAESRWIELRAARCGMRWLRPSWMAWRCLNFSGVWMAVRYVRHSLQRL